MSLRLPSFQNSLRSGAEKSQRITTTTSSAGADAFAAQNNAYFTGKFIMGTIIRTGPGEYDAVVLAAGKSEIPCILGTSSGNYFHGVNDCNVPSVGDLVIVYLPYPDSGFGVMVAGYPAVDKGEQVDPQQILVDLFETEPGKTAQTESAYESIASSASDTSRHVAHMGRPQDLFPGTRAWVNEYGVGLALLNLVLSLKASERARIDISLIDDSIRMISGYHRHESAIGVTSTYNDGGRMTTEELGTPYQQEVLGRDSIGNTILTADEQATLDKPMHTGFKLAEDLEHPKYRYRKYLGYLGDLFNLFISKPKKAPLILEENAKPENDQGLMHTHIDSSGRLIVRSASGISLQRWDRIAIPLKLKEPWDPLGDMVEDITDELQKPAFTWNAQYPYSRHLQIRDAYAYYNKLAYQRLLKQSKDFQTPNEADIVVPDDEYDVQNKGTEPFAANNLRQSYFNQEPDGSFIFRDAWGSEIRMCGGNITISCPGQLTFQSGKSIVNLAGRDYIAKAKRSADITTNERDVRIKGQNNVQIAAILGGILVESKSTRAGGQYTAAGDAVQASGIVLKAATSTIFTQGKVIHNSATRDIKFETYGDAAENNGVIYISANRIISNAKSSALFSAGEDAGLFLTTKSAVLAGTSAIIAGDKQVAVIDNKKAWQPLTKVDIDDDPYAQIQKGISEMYEYVQTKTDWLSPYIPDATVRNSIEFTYRTSDQYGTLSATEINGATQFVVYQASWEYLASIGHPLFAGVSAVAWGEEPKLNDQCAWPGAGALNSYVRLDTETNVEANGVAKKWNEVTNNAGQLALKSIELLSTIR